MLVLSAHKGEALYIKCPNGDEIEVRVCEVRRDKLRLGFTADEKYVIVREKFRDVKSEDWRIARDLKG